MANITWSEYVDRYADLGDVWNKIENKTEGDQYTYWSGVLGANPTKEKFGQYHWEKEGGSSGTYDGQSRSLARDWTSTSTDTTTVNTNTDPSTETGDPHTVTYDAPDKIVTAAAEERPDYEGPEHEGYRDYDPTPVGITLAEVQDDELVENRIANMLDKGSPLFRQAAEAMARKFGNRGPRAQEAMMGEIMKVAGPIAMADALMLERHRALRNTAFYDQMKTRLAGAIQETLSHIAGGYEIQATLINDITNRWKAQLLADVQTYGIDVGAATKVYATDVGFQSAKYVADIQKFLGMEGIKVKFAEIFANIEDNAEAAAFIWDMVFGDNNLNPSEWIKYWKDKYGDDDDSTSTNTSTVEN
jgi:hypothetical protein